MCGLKDRAVHSTWSLAAVNSSNAQTSLIFNMNQLGGRKGRRTLRAGPGIPVLGNINYSQSSNSHVRKCGNLFQKPVIWYATVSLTKIIWPPKPCGQYIRGSTQSENLSARKSIKNHKNVVFHSVLRVLSTCGQQGDESCGVLCE